MEISKRRKILQIANILTPIICFLLLGLTSMISGVDLDVFQTPGESSLIDPAGYAFAIWGPIFLFLFIFLVYQSKGILKGSVDEERMRIVDQVSIFFILSTILTSLWYLIWSIRIIWLASLFLMLYLVSIIAAYLRLNINRIERSKKEFLSVVVPWSMYAGWVTAANIVSITTLLESINFNRPIFLFSDAIWAVIVLIVAAIIYLAVLLTRNDYIYASVGIWVLLAIIVERFSASNLVIEVVVVSIIGIIALSGISIYKFIKSK